jgi:hypothetical protein
MFVSYYVSFIFYSFHFNIDVLTCSCLFYYRMSKKSSLERSFLNKSKDGNKEGLFQGSSSSLSRCEALIRVVQADFPGHGATFMNEVIYIYKILYSFCRMTTNVRWRGTRSRGPSSRGANVRLRSPSSRGPNKWT